MDKELLPIGTVIELNDEKKLIIIDYEINNSIKGQHKLNYFCAGYPTYFLTDLIPISKRKEFEEKYKFYNTDTYLNLNSDYKIIHMGYKNDKFIELQKSLMEN